MDDGLLYSSEKLQKAGFPPGMFEREGVQNGWGSLPGEKTQIFYFLVPKMVYFNWNDSKICNIILFSFPTKGGG